MCAYGWKTRLKPCPSKNASFCGPVHNGVHNGATRDPTRATTMVLPCRKPVSGDSPRNSFASCPLLPFFSPWYQHKTRRANEELVQKNPVVSQTWQRCHNKTALICACSSYPVRCLSLLASESWRKLINHACGVADTALLCQCLSLCCLCKNANEPCLWCCRYS